MPSELLPEEDRPGVPIAPPLLFVLPIVTLLVIEWFVPTTFTQGTFRWNLGAIFFVAGLALSIAGFVTQKRAGTDPIPFNRAHASSHMGRIVSVAIRCISV
jgi:hypothetical protein